jgi:DNA-binding response OmpR family regulator
MADDKKNILLVEDDKFLAEMYANKLTSSDFNVEVAQDGAQAVSLAAEHKPNLILLDVVLPKMDGFEVLQAIKKDKALAAIPIIMLTNLGQKEEVEKGLRFGACDYIIKAHFTPTEVVAKVRKVLKG